jgi:hypothetical protein
MYFLMLVFTMITQAADVRGAWAIEPALGPNRTPIPDRIQLVFFLPRGGITSNSFAFDPSVFRGLTPAQMASPVRAATRFEIVREAGTFVCEGYFEAGYGKGTYLFQPNSGFRSRMFALGLQDIEERQLLDMALHDVGPRLLAELRDTGVSVSTVSQLMSMRIQGVTGEYIREMLQIFPSASSRDLVNMRVQAIWPDYVREMQQMYPSASIQDVINMKVQAIWPDYVRDMRQMYPSASIRDLINMKVQGIWPDYAQEMRQIYPSASIQDLLNMKVHGVWGRR